MSAVTRPTRTLTASARTLRNRSFVAGAIVGIALTAIAYSGLVALSDAVADPWGGVPWCTPAIADAGGICHGEPGP